MTEESREKYIAETFLDYLEKTKSMEIPKNLAPFVATCLTVDYIINVNNGNIDLVSQSLLRKVKMLGETLAKNQ